MLRPELPDTGPGLTALSWHVADLYARRELLRANAEGARRMAESFDAEADRLNDEIRAAHIGTEATR